MISLIKVGNTNSGCDSTFDIYPSHRPKTPQFLPLAHPTPAAPRSHPSNVLLDYTQILLKYKFFLTYQTLEINIKSTCNLPNTKK